MSSEKSELWQEEERPASAEEVSRRSKRARELHC